MIFARKLNKMPKFYMIFARKIFFPIFWEWETAQLPPSPSVSYAYASARELQKAKKQENRTRVPNRPCGYV